MRFRFLVLDSITGVSDIGCLRKRTGAFDLFRVPELVREANSCRERLARHYCDSMRVFVQSGARKNWWNRRMSLFLVSHVQPLRSEGVKEND